MPVFAADRHVPGISMEQLAGAQKAAINGSERATADGRPVRYIRSMYIPEDDRCRCLFEADSAADVERVNRDASIPFERVVLAHDLTPR